MFHINAVSLVHKEKMEHLINFTKVTEWPVPEGQCAAIPEAIFALEGQLACFRLKYLDETDT